MKAYLKFLVLALTIAAVLTIANGLVSNFLESKTLPDQTGIFLKRRMQSMLVALPQLMDTKENLAFFWGASEIENGIDTQVLDEVFALEGLSLKAVNVGMRNIHPVVYQQFSDKVQDQLLKRNKKIKVSFVKVPINKLTQRYAKKFNLESMTDQFSVVTDFADQNFLSSYPSIYAKSLAQHYLLLNASPHVFETLTEMYLRKELKAPHEEPLKKYFSVWSEPVFMEKEFWSLAERGTYRWNMPASAEHLKRRLAEKKHPVVKQSSYRYFNHCCGMNVLIHDEELLKAFAEHVRNVARVSDHIVLYNIPDEADYKQFQGPRYEGSKTSLYAQISLATGYKVYDLSAEVPLSDEHFMDFLHLSEDGQRAYYPALIKAALPASL